MIEWLTQWLALDVRQLLLVLAASFVIGLSMEGRKAEGKRFSPGGVRTLPLICLGGFLLAKLGQWWDVPAALPFLVGLVVLGGLVTVLYLAKVRQDHYGMTTEVFLLATYILGGLVAAEQWWMAAALTVLMVLIQELKDPIERLAGRFGEGELVTVAKFVLITAVILPTVPDRAMQFTLPGEAALTFALNPRKIWWVVVAVAAISYASYLLQRFTRRGRHGLLLTGLLGGAYSSTLTTVVLSRRSRSDGQHSPAGLAGAILSASGVMYLRILALVAIFGWPIAKATAWPLVICAAVGVGVGAVLAMTRTREGHEQTPLSDSPLELRAAFGFAAVFVGVLLVTRAARQLLGAGGLYGVAAVSGLGVVDPFVLSLTQGPAEGAALGRAALAILVAAGANNLAKACYALVLGEGRSRLLSAGLLAGLTAVTAGAWWLAVMAGWTPTPW